MPIAPPRKRRKKRNASQMNSVGSPSPESVIDEAARNIQNSNKPVIKAYLAGDSNSHDLPLGGGHSDDSMILDVTKSTQGGLKVSQANATIANLPDDDNLEQYPAVILHVGSCNFPVEEAADIDRLYNEYVEMLGTVNRRFINARVFISGIPPRRGYLNCKVNRDIATMNAKLEALANTDEGLSYVNNMVFLADDDATLDGLFSTKPEDDIHLSSDGKSRVASALFDQIRNDLTQVENQPEEEEEWSVGV